MSTFQAQQLLATISQLAQRQQQAFSREEIKKKIQEIKYLSAQKKIPQLSLRKEIVHLEHKLDRIWNLEFQLIRQKKRENLRVAAFQRQIAALRKKLIATEDKDLQQKVGRLSHLLGECLAKHTVRQEVSGLVLVQENKLKKQEQQSKLLEFRKRVVILRHQLQVAEELQQLPFEQLQQMRDKIGVLEEKLKEYSLPSSFPTEQAGEEIIHHQILFGEPQESIKDSIEKELPLPPPPKIRR